MKIAISLKQFVRNISSILDYIFSRSILLYSILAIYFILKVIFSIYTGFDGVQVEDWSIAFNIATYNQYSEFISVGPCAYKLPTYPFFLAFFIKVFGIGYAKIAVVIVQHALFSILPLIFIRIGKEIKKVRESQLTSLLFLISPSYFYYSNAIEVTNIFILLLALWVLIAIKLYNQNSRIKYLIVYFAILSALLSLTQVLFVPLFVLYLVESTKKLKLKQILIISFVALISYSPWVIRNYISLHEFIPSKTPIWQNLYFGYLEKYQYFEVLKLVPESKVHEIDSLRAFNTDIQMEEKYKQIVIEIHNKNEYIILKKAMANFLYLWYTPPKYIIQDNFSIFIARKLYSIIINSLSLMAIFYMWRENRKLVLIMLFVFAIFSIPYMLTHATNVRFKLDFEWIQLFFISCFLIYFSNQSKPAITNKEK